MERGVKPQLVTIETLDSHASPQSFQDAFCRVSEDLTEKLLGGYWAWPGGFGSSFSILGAPQTLWGDRQGLGLPPPPGPSQQTSNE